MNILHVKIKAMQNDAVDLFIQQWSHERPDLDATPLGVSSRLLMIYRHIEHAADRVLAAHGLTLWQFDVLAALRRSGPPFALSASGLSRLVTLSSGAMTHRIDRLEVMGLVQRRDTPHDRRGVLIALTEKGRALIDEAAPTRLEHARSLLAALDPEEQRTLADLLRRLLLAQVGTRPAPSRTPSDTKPVAPVRAGETG